MRFSLFWSALKSLISVDLKGPFASFSVTDLSRSLSASVYSPLLSHQSSRMSFTEVLPGRISLPNSSKRENSCMNGNMLTDHSVRSRDINSTDVPFWVRDLTDVY